MKKLIQARKILVISPKKLRNVNIYHINLFGIDKQTLNLTIFNLIKYISLLGFLSKVLIIYMNKILFIYFNKINKINKLLNLDNTIKNYTKLLKLI